MNFNFNEYIQAWKATEARALAFLGSDAIALGGSNKTEKYDIYLPYTREGVSVKLLAPSPIGGKLLLSKVAKKFGPHPAQFAGAMERYIDEVGRYLLFEGNITSYTSPIKPAYYYIERLDGTMLYLTAEQLKDSHLVWNWYYCQGRDKEKSPAISIELADVRRA